MKPTRILASATLIVSSLALITAAGISVGDEPGVVRMGSHPPQADSAPTQMLDPPGSGVATLDGGPPEPYMGMYPQPAPYAPYFERSHGATQQLPNSAYQPTQPFGPIMMFETNIGDGLGYNQSYQRLNARIPYHIIPNTNVLIGDISASVTNNGDPLANVGLIYRNYDSLRDRIFGFNAYGDYDQGYGNGDWYQVGAGYESLGKYLDFRANGYFVTGNDSNLLSSDLVGNLFLAGNNVFRTRNVVRDNAYSGVQAEVGGPLPVLGQYGLNMYAGGYYLHNGNGHDAPGFQARWQALITESLRVNTYLTSDDTFGTNSWVSLQYDIPNYKNRRVLRPSSVRDRLQDPVVRDNRIHTNIDRFSAAEACINGATGLAYNLIYVDPNATGLGSGAGTFEDPYKTMQFAAAGNSAAVDIIRVEPRDDASGTNLTINGGLTLFDDQALISANNDYELFRSGTTPFYIPGTGATGPGPLLTRPNMVAGGSVVRLANNNTIVGMQFDAANTAGTIFGNGVSNPLPITGVNLTGNTFSNYVVGADLQDVSGRVIVDGNTFTGRPALSAIRSTYGLRMTAAGGGSTTDLLLTNNTATTNQIAGLSVTAQAGSTLNAHDLDGDTAFVPPATGKYVFDSKVTGITENVVTGNGNGIEVLGNAGSTINAGIEDNTMTARATDGTVNLDASNGLLARTDGGIFNLSSLRNNTISGNALNAPAGVISENGALLHYLNGGTFMARSEDINEDQNFNGILDPGEDLDGDTVLDVANGTLDPGEDLNGNGILDQGIVSNVFQNNAGVGLCIFGETAGTGSFTIGGPNDTLGNLITLNDNAGLAADFTGTATATIDSMFNTITEQAFIEDRTTAVSAAFVVSGDTYNSTNGSNLLTNLSASADISEFVWNLERPPGFLDHEFDTTIISTIFGTIRPGNPFNSVNNSEIVTGLTSVNGTPFGLFPPSLVPDRGQRLQLDFAAANLGPGGFNNTEQFLWELDVDNNFTRPDGGRNGIDGDTVLGNALTGSTASFTFLADFDGSGTFSTRTFEGQLTAVPASPVNPPDAAQFVVNTQVVVPIFKASSSALGDGVRINASDNAQVTQFRSVNDVVTRNKGTAISVVANDNSTVNSLTIQGATIVDNRGRGINIEAHDNAVITASSTIGGFDTRTLGQNIISGTSYTEGNQISQNGSDGVRFLASNGGTINGNLINNTIEDNLGDGASLVIDNGGTLNFGNLANNELISRNTINGNSGAGLRLTDNVTPTTISELNSLIQGNSISDNISGGIVGEMTGPNNPPLPPLVNPNNVMNLTINDSAYVDLTAEQNRNVIANNGNVGIGVSVGGNGLANVTLNNASVTGTLGGVDPRWNGDGLGLKRSDSSLLLATVTNSTFTGNAGDGMDVDAQGNDRFDPNQPMSGTANTVTVLNSIFNNNGLNGAQYRLRGEATLISDVTGSSFNNNGQNGVLVQTSEFSSFGDPTDGLPPGRRSVFDGNTFNENGVDGVQLVATDDSRVLVEITSTQVPASPAPHAGANTNGDTSISNNGRDGVRIDTTGGRSDILITSGTGQTTIDGNGTTAGGNGIRWNSSGASDGTVRVTKTIIRNSVAGITETTANNNNGVLDPGEDLNGNGVLDPGEDTNSNEDVDVVDGDGIQANFFDNATATLIVGGIGVDDGNTIQSNADDGIAITATGQAGQILGPPPRIPRPTISIVGNTIGGTNNGTPAGNGGDGISVNLLGGTAVGIAPGDVDFTTSVPPDFSDTTVSFNGGATEAGPIPQITINNNLISQNTRKGANILLTGAGGVRDRATAPGFLDLTLITFTNNTIVSNGEEGIFYRADSDMNQSRFVYLPNFPDPPETGFDNTNYSPFSPEFLALNIGSVNGNTEYVAPYLNLRTVQNSYLTVTDNTIQNNGTGGVTGEGLFIKVGTGSYVAGDIQNNVFGGNLEEDFRTASFLSAGQTFDSVDNTGDGTRDFVYLDDTAQLDVRFQNNSGNQIDANARGDNEILTDNLGLGATYSNPDPLKEQFFGPISVLRRRADLFQVDNGPGLNDPNNIFQSLGVTQNINNNFSRAGTNYNVRAAADPLFPNIGFAPFLP